MRPVSYLEKKPYQRCQTCAHFARLEYSFNGLCLHGEQAEIIQRPNGASSVKLNGQLVECLEGDALDRATEGRKVEPWGMCDQWADC